MLLVLTLLGALVRADVGHAQPAAEARADAVAAEPAPDCGPAVTAAVQARYDGLAGLSASFRQVTRSVAFGGASEPEAASGRVWFAKPGRMRWEYELPEPSLVVSDGSTLWIYDPGAHEAQKLSVDEGFLSAAAVQFLLGEGRIDETFEVTALDCGEGEARLELRPREPATYERLEIAVDRASGWIVETLVVDLFGNMTRVAFADLDGETAVAPGRFRFEPPEGARVLTLEPSPPEPEPAP